MLIIIFGSLTLTMSFGLFVSFYPFEVITALCAVGLMIAQMVHFIRYFRKYLFFDTIFDSRNEKVKKYLTAFFVSKVICALLISLLRNHTLVSCILIFLIQLVFSIMATLMRPYLNKIMNILTICA